MTVTTVRTYTVTITRDDEDPEQEFHVRRLIALRTDNRPDEGIDKVLFLQEMELAWDQLHRFIRRMEVGEE